MSWLRDLVDTVASVDVTALVSKVKGTVLNYNESQKRVEEATTDHPWGASSTLMQDIAADTHGFQSFHDTMDLIYMKLQERGNNWRQCYKALQLIDYLIRNGAEKVIDNVRDHAFELKVLAAFKHVDVKGKDQVRNRAEEILLLLSDPEKIKSERATARENKGKYSGTSNAHSSSSQSSNYNQTQTADAISYNRQTLPKVSEERPVAVSVPVADLMNISPASDDDWGDFTDAKATTSEVVVNIDLLSFAPTVAQTKPLIPATMQNSTFITASKQSMQSVQATMPSMIFASSMMNSDTHTSTNAAKTMQGMNDYKPASAANYNSTTFASSSQTQRPVPADPFQSLAGFTFPKKAEPSSGMTKNAANLIDL